MVPSFTFIRPGNNWIAMDYNTSILKPVAHADLKRLAGNTAIAGEAA